MTYTVLLGLGANTRNSEEEEKSKFIRSIMECLDVDVDFWHPEQTLTIEDRIKLRALMSQYDITVRDFADGSIEVYFEKQRIGEWSKPHYILKRDHTVIDPAKQLYIEMHVSCSSVFEEEHPGAS